MEISKQDIKKISNEFKIPEKDILNFLAETDHADIIISLKKTYLKEKKGDNKKYLANSWQKECQTYGDFEDCYVSTEPQHIEEGFYLAWFKSCKYYTEKREVYSCVKNHEKLRQEIIIHWINFSTDLEDVREAISYVNKESAEYKIGIRKIINFYKN